MLIISFILAGCGNGSSHAIKDPEFENVSVHDPSVIKTKDRFYVIGSHMAFAKSEDLIKWEQLSKNVTTTNLFDDIQKEFEDEFDYAQTDTFWAGDIQKLKDGKYYMYYCLCKGDSPLSALGVAVADDVEGPYKKKETFLYSGTSPQFDKEYDATVDPNVVDPHVFYDDEGKLWMVYGSYSGGIYLLEMDENTGLPKDRHSYGKRLTGGNHCRIEAPYILYNHKTGYYYLFTSFGGLDSFGGYNIRVARSKSVEGPYEDSEGQPMVDAMGKKGSFFDDKSIENYGVKLIGNFLYEKDDGLANAGYVSPGHNSAYYDEKTDKYFLLFHTRFPNSGELHELRVHQMFFNEEGWPAVSPIRYADEKIENYHSKQVSTRYKMISFSKEINDYTEEPTIIELKNSGKIVGIQNGRWHLAKNNEQNDSILTINDIEYKGKFLFIWDENQEKQVMTFTGISKNGVPLYLVEDKEKKP